MTNRNYYVYILASRKNGTLYIGMTNNLFRRIYLHRSEVVKGFTSKYKVHKLVYFEVTEKPNSAIIREKQLKNWHRQWKINLIEEYNPQWRDLYPELLKQG